MTATRPAGQPLGGRLARPHHPHGWHVDRDQPDQHQGGGKRPPLADNLPDPPERTPRP